MRALETLENHLKPGHLYRRADLEKHSNAVDRHLKQLQKNGVLKKLSGGLYHYPRQTKFGEAPPTDHELVKSFLKDDRFLLFSQNAYNSLGLGTTQLYNETLVYNHKRHGTYKVGGRTFKFVRKTHFPDKVTKEFLLIDLLNNENSLKEDAATINKAKELAREMSSHSLRSLLNELDWKHAKLVLNDIVSRNGRYLHINLKKADYQFAKSTPYCYKESTFA